MSVQLTTRDASLETLADLLKDHRARRLDVVAPAETIVSAGGKLVVHGSVQEITEDGVTTAAGIYAPTSAAVGDIASRLNIDTRYLRKCLAERPDIYDANVNGWLHGSDLVKYGDDGVPQGKLHEADPRSFMLRLLRGDDGGEGVVRAMLSDRYFVIDNLDILISVLAGIREAEADVQVLSCDLTESRMFVRVASPGVRALAPKLLADYRNPWTGQELRNGFGGSIGELRKMAEREGKGYAQGAEPVLFAGLLISNSELGDGAFSIKPRITVEMCGNSHTVEADAMRVVHLGGKMEAGVVKWSDETNRRALELVASKTRDAVATFLTPAYVERQIADAEAKAGIVLDDAPKVIHEVITKSALPAGLEDDVLKFFTRGGQNTAGGVMQAVTAVAQLVPDAELQADLEDEALRVLDLAAAAA